MLILRDKVIEDLTYKKTKEIIMSEATHCDSENFGAVLNCAIRYCIGRQTYMPKLVMDFIRPLLPSLSDITITVMIKDIEKADNLGDKNIDEPEWKRFLAECKKELDERK